MKRLFIVTLEPIDQRYTKQWYSYLRPEFKKYFDVVDYIDGGSNEEQKIDTGQFLDINKTNMWKAEQIKIMSFMFEKELVEKDDTFLFMDGWHYGITALKYMSQLNNIPIKIFAYWHAGTWDENDFITQAGLRAWAPMNEAGWLLACDGHFVATEYHKKLICDYFNNNSEINKKIFVVGFPMDWKNEIKDIKKVEKENIIVFPHRLSKEKQPEIFEVISKQLKQYKFIKTMQVTKNKQEYYTLLSKSKIVFSSSLQETFGLGVVEAMLFGCIPVVPDRLSYSELYDIRFQYKTIKEAKKLIEFYIKNYDKFIKVVDNNINDIKNKSLNSIKEMSKVML